MAEAPEARAGGAFRIAADGTWFHDGAPIVRPALVRLFARALRREPDGAHWLVTPAERVPVEVEDAPFLAVELAVEGSGRSARLRLRTNVGDWVVLNRAHPLIVRGDPESPRPYLALGGGLEARLARPVYYELAARAEPGPDGVPGVWSAGTPFPLVPDAAAP